MRVISNELTNKYIYIYLLNFLVGKKGPRRKGKEGARAG